MKPDAVPAVVVFAPVQRDAVTLRQVIEEEAMCAHCCADAGEFYAALGATPLFAVMTEEGVARCSPDDLGRIFRMQAPWSNLPLLVLADPDQRRIDTNRFVHLADIGNVTLLTRPVARLTLVMALRSARRTRQLQFALREQMRELAAHADMLESKVAERTRELQAEVAERRRVEQSLAEARRLESLGQLTGGIAHDFNNILQVVTGSETLLRMLLGATPDPKMLRALQSIRRAADQGASLTQQLLAYARRQPLANVVLDMRRHLHTVSEMILHMLGPDVQVRLQIAPSLWRVMVDPSQLDAALLNIAGNARDAMPHPGRLLVAARNRVLPDAALPEGAHLAGDFVEVCVTDNGHGMSAETAQNAFEPFFTTKPFGKGTGLGLSQVYGFAIQSKGLAFIRREESGTTVGILLPRSESAPRALAYCKGLPQQVKGMRVLYVEDDPDVAEVTAAMLQSLGAVVTMADSADAAMRLDLSDIDAVLSDVMMPGELDGIGLARWLASQHPRLPVVLTSGYVLDPERLQGLKVQFVRKPCAIGALADTLVKAVEQAGQA